MRLVVFDVNDTAPLLSTLLHTNPGTNFAFREDWAIPRGERRGNPVPLWHWTESASVLSKRSSSFLREFAYPLTAGGGPYCVAFSFGRGEFERVELSLRDLSHLDFEDIGTLLCGDALCTTLELLPQLRDRLTLTPIEQALADAMDEVGLTYKTQARIGDYRVDFLIEEDGIRLAIEADGRPYHEPDKDDARDEALRRLGVSDILHFTGGRLHRDAESCAMEVQAALAGMRAHPIRLNPQPLDQSQQRASGHGRGAARVLAPAGSGKTRTMVHRVATLIEHGVDPSAILVLAFNRKAAEQLIDNLMGMGVPVVKGLKHDQVGVHAATFNAFGYRYQRDVIEHHSKLATEPGAWSKLMSEAMRQSGVNLGTAKAKRGVDPVQGFLRQLARVRADLQDPASLEVEIESYGAKNTVVSFAPVEAAFQELQLRQKVQSFDDQIYLAVRDMLAVPGHRRFVQERYEHVLVDEFQDLNGAQLALVDILSRPHRDLFVVGDDDQLIYGWRFAHPANILDFHERMPPKPHSATYSLSVNYRCSKAVVESSQRLIAHNTVRVPKDIRPRKGASEGAVTFVQETDWASRAAAVVGFLRTQHELPFCEWRDLAVLCRYRSQQLLVALALDNAAIPRSALLAYRLFTHQVASLLHAYLRLVSSPGQLNADELRLLVNRPNRYVKNATVDKLCAAKEPWSALVHFTRGVEGQGEMVPGALRDLVTRVDRLGPRMRDGHLTAGEAVAEVLTEFGLEAYWEDSAQGASAQQDDAGPREVLDAIRTLAVDYPRLGLFLTEWERLVKREEDREDIGDDTLRRERNEDEDCVVIGTIHSAKGREYRSVVVLDYHCDLTRLAPEQVEEERRVLYVGVTRAKDDVLLTIDASGGSVHPFFKELIRPAEKLEAESVRRRLEELPVPEEDAIVEREEARAELELVTSGKALDEAKRQFTKLGGKDELESLKDRLAQTEREIEYLGFWSGVSGRRSRLLRELAEQRRQLAALETANRSFLLLKGDPGKAARPAAERLEKAGAEVAALALERAVLESRLVELGILG